EHFDLSVDLGDEKAGRRGTFGASPGDAVDPDPYLYVTHWADVAEHEYWNEEHFPGASLTIDTLAAAPDQRASALTFLRRGRELLRGPLPRTADRQAWRRARRPRRGSRPVRG